jgi:hypothetical protein
MPLDPKSPTRTLFHEFGTGKTYRRTKKKFGKRRADRQRIAVVLSVKRRGARGKKRRNARHKRRTHR